MRSIPKDCATSLDALSGGSVEDNFLGDGGL